MYASKYSTQELMAAVCAREIKDKELVFVGVGIPMLAGLVATKTHAKNTVLVYEAGGLGAMSRRLPYTISDNPTTDNALMAGEMWRVFADTQCGMVDKGVVGGAQIDKYGNLNTTVITKNGTKSYKEPAIRLPGSGGANDIASSCKETIIVMRLEPGKFVERVDYITTPGYIDGPGAREKAGLRWGGPTAVITNKCILRFDNKTKEMYLDSLYPGVTVEEITTIIKWDLKVAKELKTVEPPLVEQLEIMHKMDPNGIILGTKTVTKEESFEDFYQKMKSAYNSVTIEL